MGLLSTLGGHHRRQRKLLNPVFSINHMRSMLPTFTVLTHQVSAIVLTTQMVVYHAHCIAPPHRWLQLDEVMKAKLKNGPQEIDVLEWMTRVALELIGQGGLGYSFETLDETKSNRYANAVKLLLCVALSLFSDHT